MFLMICLENVDKNFQPFKGSLGGNATSVVIEGGVVDGMDVSIGAGLVVFKKCIIRRPIYLKLPSRVRFEDCVHIPVMNWFEAVLAGVLSQFKPDVDWVKRFVPMYRVIN